MKVNYSSHTFISEDVHNTAAVIQIEVQHDSITTSSEHTDERWDHDWDTHSSAVNDDSAVSSDYDFISVSEDSHSVILTVDCDSVMTDESLLWISTSTDHSQTVISHVHSLIESNNWSVSLPSLFFTTSEFDSAFDSASDDTDTDSEVKALSESELPSDAAETDSASRTDEITQLTQYLFCCCCCCCCCHSALTASDWFLTQEQWYSKISEMLKTAFTDCCICSECITDSVSLQSLSASINDRILIFTWSCSDLSLVSLLKELRLSMTEMIKYWQNLLLTLINSSEDDLLLLFSLMSLTLLSQNGDHKNYWDFW